MNDLHLQSIFGCYVCYYSYLENKASLVLRPINIAVTADDSQVFDSDVKHLPYMPGKDLVGKCQ